MCCQSGTAASSEAKVFRWALHKRNRLRGWRCRFTAARITCRLGVWRCHRRTTEESNAERHAEKFGMFSLPDECIAVPFIACDDCNLTIPRLRSSTGPPWVVRLPARLIRFIEPAAEHFLVHVHGRLSLLVIPSCSHEPGSSPSLGTTTAAKCSSSPALVLTRGETQSGDGHTFKYGTRKVRDPGLFVVYYPSVITIPIPPASQNPS